MKDSATYISRFRSGWKGSIFLLMASVLLFATSARATLHSSCSLSPVPVQVNESCEVNCTFTEDVQGKQFVVLLYDESPTANVATVVDCYFIGTERKCEVENGYNFNCQPGKIQTVFIPKADKKFEGKYVCQLLTEDEQEIEPCTLRVAEANSESNVQVHEENGVPPSAGTQRPNGNSEHSGVPVPAVVIPSVLVPVLVVILIAIFLLRSKRQRRSNKTDVENVKEKEPLTSSNTPKEAKKRNDEGQPQQALNSGEEGRTDSSGGSLLDGGHPNPKMRTTLNAGSVNDSKSTQNSTFCGVEQSSLGNSQSLQAGNMDQEEINGGSDDSLTYPEQSQHPSEQSVTDTVPADNAQHEPDMPTDRRWSSPNSACVPNHTAGPKPGKKRGGGSRNVSVP